MWFYGMADVVSFIKPFLANFSHFTPETIYLYPCAVIVEFTQKPSISYLPCKYYLHRYNMLCLRHVGHYI